MMYPETQLKKFLVERLPLNKERVTRHNGETPVHLRFKSNCGFTTFDQLKESLDALGLNYKTVPYKHFSRSPDYGDQGLVVNFNGESVGIQFNVPKDGNMSRKQFTPDALNLNGLTFDNKDVFRAAVLKGIEDSEFFDFLVSMLDNVESGNPIVGLEAIREADVNRITSDYGEVVCAYTFVLKGHTVFFPEGSNHKIADFYVDGQGVSAKGRGTGGKVNLSGFAEYINTETTAGKFLYSVATHNRNDFVKYAAELSPEVKAITDWVGGTDRNALQKFVANTTYNEFYTYIQNAPEHKGLGMPDNGGRPEALWNQGSLDPIDFTINTLVSRLWGENAVAEISKIVTEFLNEPMFVVLDIENNQCIIKETNFSDVAHWKTVYWSRATKAWHNWLGVEPVKGL
jgi:hypothetical protein